MIFRALVFLIVVPLTLRGQSEFQKDSLINELCKTINSTPELDDSTKVEYAFKTHLYPFADKLKEEEREDFKLSVFYRLHRSCTEFYKIQYRLNKTNGDMMEAGRLPGAASNKINCADLLSHPRLFYLESSGDTAIAVIENGIWTETFIDKTHSKLRFKWLSDCVFELEFIESTNDPRKRFSKPGDKYRYTILNKERSFYLMSVEIVGNDAIMNFKIYY